MQFLKNIELECPQPYGKYKAKEAVKAGWDHVQVVSVHITGIELTVKDHLVYGEVYYIPVKSTEPKAVQRHIPISLFLKTYAHTS